MKSILDSAFRYTPSTQTDLRKTFARLRREQRAADANKAPVVATIQPQKQPGAVR
jgi:hypothetical protein